MLIWQEFNDKHECPLCAIKQIVEVRLVERYLNESVMVDDRRREVNEKGFCLHHMNMMFARNNKLSLSLQQTTRLTNLKYHMMPVLKEKEIDKLSDYFIHSTTTCVICDSVNTTLIRYYKTIAQMYYNEPKFRETLDKTKGFCMNHFGLLLKYSRYAKSQRKNYANTLISLQKRNVDRVLTDLCWFAEKHDYRNQDKPWGEAYDAVPRAMIKMQQDEGK